MTGRSIARIDRPATRRVRSGGSSAQRIPAVVVVVAGIAAALLALPVVALLGKAIVDGALAGALGETRRSSPRSP